MKKVKLIASLTWALPATIIGLIATLSLKLLGCIKKIEKRSVAYVVTLEPKQFPVFIQKYWSRRSGQSIGNIIFVKYELDTDKGLTTLKHELEHVNQYMTFGVFTPILYWAFYAVLSTCRNVHPHYDNPFEIASRRSAGQVIDVVGAVQQAHVKGLLKHK